MHLWSRGEELITQRFPEIVAAASQLPDGTVLDGEILAFRDDRPLPFSALQQRIGRQKQVATLLRTVPVVFMAYDILEDRGEDVRGLTQDERRARLEARLTSARLPDETSEPAGGTLRGPEAGQSAVALRPTPRAASRIVASARSSTLGARREASWLELVELRADSRARGVEGLMLKRRTSAYGVGRKRGDWWKWKIAPFTIDAVLIYAQPGSGRRASLLTDYTFGVWDAGELVPVAKAYSGLSNEEIAEMDAGSAGTRASASGRCATSSRCTSSSSASRPSPPRRGIAPASRSASLACCAGAGTRKLKRPTRSNRWRGSSAPR